MEPQQQKEPKPQTDPRPHQDPYLDQNQKPEKKTDSDPCIFQKSKHIGMSATMCSSTLSRALKWPILD